MALVTFFVRSNVQFPFNKFRTIKKKNDIDIGVSMKKKTGKMFAVIFHQGLHYRPNDIFVNFNNVDLITEHFTDDRRHRLVRSGKISPLYKFTALVGKKLSTYKRRQRLDELLVKRNWTNESVKNPLNAPQRIPNEFTRTPSPFDGCQNWQVLITKKSQVESGHAFLKIGYFPYSTRRNVVYTVRLLSRNRRSALLSNRVVWAAADVT